MEGVLPRSSEIIEKDSFLQLVSMIKDNDWLTIKYGQLWDLWQLTSCVEQRDLLEILIRDFNYITSREIDTMGRTIANEIIDNWNLDSTKTLISAVCTDSNPDGSQVIVQSIKNKFNNKKFDICNNLDSALKKLKNSMTLVLADDFIGTGDTICTKILPIVYAKIKEMNLVGVNVNVIAFAAMNFAKEKLDNEKIEYFSCMWLNKGISDNTKICDIEQAKNLMKEMEASLSPNLPNGKFHLGYNQSETLFCNEGYNIPNNVFPIFWYRKKNDTNYKPMFDGRV